MSVAAETDPPRYVESVPTATTPVDLPDLRAGQARFLAGVITGGVLFVLAVVELVAGLVVIA